ncbi:uncharacterized protein B0P05DRAFT_552445 [Gilbertella persicaria]|uniref:uncharacterized protein n=1 Tax=Gilbertella persicaria TaxID=101096 RepID=UPI00221E57D2|nr:uncharacterized protein B0P05DRAFT_552445 [Gilbertella persicaria]KAI8067656.1 hypothetical protein B0P05DRAFT_552445 [Gilbertella persicaria]
MQDKDAFEEDEPKIHTMEFNDELIMNIHTEQQKAEDKDQISETVEAARAYLDQDQQENIEMVIQPFFTHSAQMPEPILISKELGHGQKEIHISELSATSKGRAFLLQSACMKEWYDAGWKCPNYVYQWLFRVIGLEQNKKAAKNAFETLFVLWSLPGSRVDTKLAHIYKQRFIDLETFKSVLIAYGASDMLETDTIMDSLNNTHTSTPHLPLSQLGWAIKAFSFSIRLWSKAYTAYQIRYIVRLLLQISLDKAGYLIMQDIQAAIDNCLFAMDYITWETELKAIANDVCDLVHSRRHQFYLFDSIKTIYERSRYLRRILGLVCLERCLEQEVPGSVDYILTNQSIIKQVGHIFTHPQGFFINRPKEMDYEECYIRVAMLDAAIGTHSEEIKRDKEVVLVIAAELKNMSLQMGAKLGVMKKTMANEMIQRVWGRIFYIVGKDTKIEH